jgi:hypothetical protein
MRRTRLASYWRRSCHTSFRYDSAGEIGFRDAFDGWVSAHKRHRSPRPVRPGGPRARSGPALASNVLGERWAHLRDGAFVVKENERDVNPLAVDTAREARQWDANGFPGSKHRARLQPLGEDACVVLETNDGTVRIEGETVVSTHDITDPGEVPPEQLAKLANWTFPALQQAGVRYRWRGEETIGMLERSGPMNKVER